MFWIQNERGVDNTLMHFFAKSFYSQSRTCFSLSQWRDAEKKKKNQRNPTKNGRVHRQEGWPKLTKKTSHTTEHHSHSINWGELPASMADLGLGREARLRSAGDERLYCASMVCFLFTIIIYHYYSILLYSQLLNSSCFNIQVLLQFSSPFHQGEGDWVSSWASVLSSAGLKSMPFLGTEQGNQRFR